MIDMANLTYKELKARVSVIDVATYLGYQFDRSKGTTQPSYVLPSSNNDEADRIYIKNPLDNAIQGYWRRTGSKGGDVITFVKENLDKFNVSGRNDIDKTNIVLHNFANAVFTPPERTVNYAELFRPKTFDKGRWEIVDNSYFRDKILGSRGIDRNSSTMFSEHIDLIKDRTSNKNFVNIGFPYRVPGQKECVGYEIRGAGGFKSKASGTDSTNAMWIADFTRSSQEVRNIYIAESAFDAISYYQLNRNQLDLYASVFVSFGGSFSDHQFRNLIEHYSSAKPILLFDNDIYGRMYDIRAFVIMQGKELEAKFDKENDKVDFSIENKQFSIPYNDVSLSSFQSASGLRANNDELSVIKAKGEAKDWNEVLQLEANTTSKYSYGR